MLKRLFVFASIIGLLFFSAFNNSANAQIVINEVGVKPSAGNAAGGGEFIELFNQGNTDINIGCYVIFFTSTSGGGNPVAWTISIPANTILACGQYYLIGGAGNSPLGGSTWTTNISTGGTSWTNGYGANGKNTADLDISNAANSGLNGLRPGNLSDSKGQVTLFSNTGTVVGSVSYNNGNIAACYTGSASNAPSGCSSQSFADPGNSSFNVSFSGAEGIYLDATGNYQIETTLTPGKSNALNTTDNATQIASTCCLTPTITLTSAASVCFSSISQTTTLGYSATTNTPVTYSITWNASPANSFVAVTDASLPLSPISITVPANTPAGTYTGSIIVKNVCGQPSTATNFTIRVNTAPAINSISNQSLCANSSTSAINFSGTGTAAYNWVNNTTSIGLAASGTGNISSFTALNSGSTPVVATITATPVSVGLAYIANYGSIFSPGNTISIINTATNTVTGSITVGNNPFGVAVSPDGTRVYVSNYGSNTVSVINTSTNNVIATVAVGNQPMGLVVSPDGAKVYVANQFSNKVSVISTGTNTVTANINVSLQPQGVAISPDGTRVYVANVNSNNVSVINTATNTVLQVIIVGTQPICVGISPDGSRLFVPNFASNSVSIINTTTNTVVATTAVGTNPNGATVSPDGSKVYITNQSSSNVSVINTATNTVSNTITVGTSPQGISFTADGSRAYVANFGSNNVSAINTATNATIATVAVGQVPHSLGNFITPNVCSGTPINFTITVKPNIVSSISYTGSPFCAAGTVSPTITGTTGGNFTVNNSGLVIDATTGTINLATSTPGLYTITYNLSASNCDNSPTTNIEVTALPTVPIAGVTQQPTCSSATGTIEVSSPLGSGYSYSIDGTTFQSSPIFNGVSPGTFSIIVKNTTSGCTNTSTSITVNAAPGAPPSPTVTTPVDYCQNAITTQLSATGTNLLWYTNASGGTGSSTAPTPTSTSTVSTNYYVSQTVAGCESPRALITVNINSLPVVNAVSSQIRCNGFSTTAVNFSGTGSIYNWTNDTPSIGLAATGSGNIASFNATNTGSVPVIATITVTPKITSTNCFGSPISFSITVNPTPAAPTAAVTAQPTCTISTGTITISNPTGIGFSYSIDGISYSNTSGIFTGITSGSYNVTAKNATGCISSSTPVTVNAVPTIPAAPVITTIQPTCSTPTGTINITSPLGAAYSYSIDGTTFQSSPTFAGLSAASYTVTVKNTSGCTNTNTATLNTAASIPAPQIFFVQQPSCGSAYGTFYVTSPIGPNYKYSIDGINFQTSIYFNLFPGTYTLTAKDINTGCINTKPNIVITQSPMPITFTSTPSSCASPGSITITSPVNSLSSPTPLYLYSLTGGSNAQSSPIFSNLQPGTYTVTVNSAILCTNEIQIVITGSPNPVAAPIVTLTQPTCSTPTGTINITSPLGAAYSYSIDGTTFQSSPTFAGLSAASYTVTVKNTSGCTNTGTAVLNSISSISVPSISITQPTCTVATGSITVLTPLGVNYNYSLDGGAYQSTVNFSNIASGGHSITVKDISTNCINSSNFTINAAPTQPAAPTVTTPISYCQNATASALTATGTNLLWYTVANGGTGASTAPTPSTTTVNSTNYYVSQNTGCESPRATITVTIKANPVAPTVTSPISYCQNATASALTATGTGLLWYTVANGGTGTATVPTPATNTVNSTNYYVSQTVNTCESPRATIIVTIKSNPIAPTVTTPIGYCQNATASALTATGTSLLWYTAANGGTGTATAPTPATNTVNSTNYYVSQTVAGCESPRAAIVVDINALPTTPTITANGSTTICAGNSITLTSSAGTGNQWYKNGVLIAGAINQTYTTSSIGTYTVVVTNSNNCKATSANFVITSNTAPATPVISGNTSFCANKSLTLTSSASTGNQWYKNGVLIAGATNSTLIIAAPTNNTVIDNYTVTVTNNTNCSSTSAPHTVTQYSVPAAGVTYGSTTFCQGHSVIITSSTATGNQWLLNGAPIAGATNQTYTIAAAGNYSLTVTNANGCSNTISPIAFSQLASPTIPTITGNTSICTGGNSTLQSSAPGNNQWNFNGSPITGATGTSYSASTGGNYTVTVTNASGCSSTSAITALTVNSIPAAPTVTTPVNYCQNAIATPLTALGSNLLWYSTLTGGSGTSTAVTPITTAVVNTSYYVSQTVNNCESPRATITVSIKATPAAPVATTPVNYCQNAIATTLNATGSNLLWYTTLTGGTGTSTTPTPPTTAVVSTNYYVSQTVNNCESPRANIVVTINTKPATPVITPIGSTTFCSGNSVTLNSSSSSGNQWYKDGTIISGAASSTLTVYQAGNYTVIVTNAAGCSSTGNTINVKVNPNPIVSAGLDKTVFEGDSVLLQGFASGGTNFTYSWLPITYLSNTSIAAPWVVRPLNDITYTLKVINELGCFNTANVNVSVIKDFIIPNAFSPNGDHVNDYWEIKNLSLYKSAAIDVFDRNGQIVYKSIGYLNSWDGTYNGKQVPVGVYYYVINPGNGRNIKTGWVTLLR